MMKTIRCVVCRSEFTDEEINGANCCPRCGGTGLPMSISEDVEIKINWHELSILCNWANFWAGHADSENLKPTVRAIVNNLQKQFPLKTPLTLDGEVEQLKQLYPGIEVVESDKE